MSLDNLHIQRLKKGDTVSFEFLYKNWSGKLYNFVMRISNGDKYLAEEMVQSAFIKVWENRQTLDNEKSFGAYLCTIAKNDLSNIYRHRMLEYLYHENTMLDQKEGENNTEKDVDYHLLDEYITSLIERLPPARREIYLLSRQKHLSNREIALLLNISENTVESQLTKASSFLREEIKIHYNLSVALLILALYS